MLAKEHKVVTVNGLLVVQHKFVILFQLQFVTSP